MRTQGSSALACRHAVLSLLVPGLVLHCTSPPRPMRVQPLELHGPSCTLVCGSFPPHSPAPCLSVGPRAGSLTSSPWPSPDGPRGETPRTTGFQASYPYEAPPSSRASPLYLFRPRPLPPFPPQSCGWVVLTAMLQQMCWAPRSCRIRMPPMSALCPSL